MTNRIRGTWEGVPEARRRIMRSNRRKDTSPERAIRSLLHARGLRFRVDFPVRVDDARAIRPDIVFPKRQIAIYIDGCYWHGCPTHGTVPATNRDYWQPKIEENRRRDRRQSSELRRAGWTVIRAWEHEDAERVVARIALAVRDSARYRSNSRAAQVGQ